MNLKTLALFTALFLSLFASNLAFAGTGEVDMINVVDAYQTAATNFGNNIKKIAIGLLITLFTLEVCWSITSRFMKHQQLAVEEMLSLVLVRLMTAFFLYWAINGNILKALIDSFALIAATSADNITIAGPGDIFYIGVDIANGLLKGLSENLANTAATSGVLDAALAAMNGILPALIVGLSCFFIILAFGAIAGQYAIIMIQMYFYLAVSPLLLSFGATRFGKDLAAKQFSAAIVIGVRMIAIYFVVATAGSLGGPLQAGLANLSLENLSPLWNAVGYAFLLGFLAIKLPAMASDMVSGSASLSAGDGVAAGGALGGLAGMLGGPAAAALFSSVSAGGSNSTMPLSEAASFGIGGSGPASTSGLSGMSAAYASPSALAELTPSWMGGSSTGSSGSTGASSVGAEGSSVYNPASGSIEPSGGSISGSSANEQSVIPAPASGGEQGSRGSATTTTGSTDSNTAAQSQGGTISGGNSSVEQPAIATSSNSGGGSIGGTGAPNQAPQLNSPIAENVSQGLHEFAQAEKSSGASVNIQLGHEEI